MPQSTLRSMISVGTLLCTQYIRSRLKRSGIHRKLGLSRIKRSTKLLPGGTWVNEVYAVLSAVGEELEKTNPHLFERVGRQVGCIYFTSEQRVSDAFADVAREILRAGDNCTWAKIASIYAVAAALAVDCVRQGKQDYVGAIQRTMTNILEEDLVGWIQANGGWGGLVLKYRPAEKEWSNVAIFSVIAMSVLQFCILSVIIRLFILS